MKLRRTEAETEQQTHETRQRWGYTDLRTVSIQIGVEIERFDELT